MTVQVGVKAGKISKPYGLQGDVHIILIPAIVQELKPGNPLFIDLDGQRVPFFMETVDLVSREQAIVKVEFINSVEEARKVTGCNVYVDRKKDYQSEAEPGSSEALLNYQLVDLHLGEIGEIVDYIPGEMNPVWVIDFSGREILIPASEDFIRKIDHKSKILHLELPEGITAL